MTFTVDYATDRGLVRLTIADVDPANPVLDDAQIDALLAKESGNTDRASARALLLIAASETLKLKYIRLMDLTVDGTKVGQELRAQAKALFDLADAGGGDYEGLFDYAEMVPNVFAERERLRNQILREAV